MLKSYRPAGNPININPSSLQASRFSPLNINFYQSGTASLAAAIIASCELKNLSDKKNEILLPAYACPDLISSVLYAGATPVLIDLQENSPFLSLDDLDNKITASSTAIIAVNFLGIAEQIESIKKICEQHRLYLINDSAQWFPKTSAIENWPGDFNIISFGRGKPVNLLHGGAVITKNNDYLRELENIDVSLVEDKGQYSAAAKIHMYNLVIQPFFYAAVTRIPGLKIGETTFTKLTTITRMNSYYFSLLEKNIEEYNARTTNHELIHQNLLNISHHKIVDLFPATANDKNIALLRYPMLITDKEIRDRFFDRTKNLGVSKMYRCPLNEIRGLEYILKSQNHYPNAKNFANNLVTLPTHQDIQSSVINKIFYHIKRILSE